MNPTNKTYDELMMSYLEGQCREEEALSLLSWIAESEEHQAQFESFKAVWELTSFPMPEIESINVDAALDAVNEKIDEQENHETITVQMPWLRRNFKYVSSAAAAVIVALFIGFLVVKPNSTVTLASADWNTEEPYFLPDETSVTFFDDSKISHPKHFGNDGRSVNFEGTARFDVTKDEARPFVIHCNGMDVEVLGTSFLLNAEKNGERYFLDLYTGKVKMTTFDQKGHAVTEMEVNPGERGVWNPAQGELKTMCYSEVKEEELMTEHVLVFDNETLSKIVEALEYIYKVEIDLAESCASKKLTARFSDEESIEDVLETIALVSEVTVTKADNVYRIL
jgi:ferric-dicitrate binding protein FerR (iron transport regulator)